MTHSNTQRSGALAILLLLMALLAVATTATPAAADIFVWTGGAGTSDWDAAANWMKISGSGTHGYPGFNNNAGSDAAAVTDQTFEPVLDLTVVITELTVCDDATVTTDSHTLAIAAGGDLTVKSAGWIDVDGALVLGAGATGRIDGTVTAGGSGAGVTIGAGASVAVAGTIILSGSSADLVVGAVSSLDIDGEITLSGSSAAMTLGAGVNLAVSGTITLSGSGAALNCGSLSSADIDGSIVLANASSILKFTDNVTLTGDGGITGEHNSANIQIAAGKKFTSQVTIQGALQIKGLTAIGQNPGLFRNEKLVHANRPAAPFIIEVMANTDLEDTSGAVRWMASNSGSAKLLFQAGATGLAGDFSLSDSADLEVTQDVSTTGDVCVNTGSTVAATGACFDWGTWSCSTAPQKPLCGS